MDGIPLDSGRMDREGNIQRDLAPLLRQPAPADRVLSVVYKETSSGYGSVYGEPEDAWRSDDQVLIAELLTKFGPAPEEL